MTNKYPRRLLKRFLNVGFLLTVTFSFLFPSCKIYKPVYYFKDIQNDTIVTGFISPDLELKIQKDDVLNVGISSLSYSEDVLYNVSIGAGSGTMGGYQVGNDGSIYLHKLGKVAVSGLTRKELKNKLEKDLVPYLKDPIVNINFLNHKVTFLGETGSRVLPMPEEKISLIDVLATTAGITPNTRINSIMVIRESGNSKQFKHLNLEDLSIFTSPWYYLQPNDIVVVKPNEEKLYDEQKRIKNQQTFATALSVVSFALIIIDRIFR